MLSCFAFPNESSMPFHPTIHSHYDFFIEATTANPQWSLMQVNCNRIALIVTNQEQCMDAIVIYGTVDNRSQPSWKNSATVSYTHNLA